MLPLPLILGLAFVMLRGPIAWPSGLWVETGRQCRPGSVLTHSTHPTPGCGRGAGGVLQVPRVDAVSPWAGPGLGEGPCLEFASPHLSLRPQVGPRPAPQYSQQGASPKVG